MCQGMRYSWAAALALMVVPPVRADDDAAVAAVKEAGRAYEAAVTSRDVKALRDIFADDLQMIAANGSKLNKAEAITSIDKGADRIESIKTRDVQIRVFGDTAIETGRVKVSGKNGEARFENDLLYTDVWIKKDDRWVLASEHCCASPKR